MIETLDETDTYMKVFSTLSIDKKLDLISKLTESIRKSEAKMRFTANGNPFSGLTGAWEKDGREAESLVDEIRAARHFDRTIENL